MTKRPRKPRTIEVNRWRIEACTPEVIGLGAWDLRRNFCFKDAKIMHNWLTRYIAWAEAKKGK